MGAYKYPQEAAEIKRKTEGGGRLPRDWHTCLPTFSPSDKADATRNISGQVLNAIAQRLPELVIEMRV